MATTLAPSFTAEPESLFGPHDDSVPEMYPSPYHSTQSFQYPVLPTFTPPSRMTWPGDLGMHLHQRSQSFDFAPLSSTQAGVWSSPALSAASESPAVYYPSPSTTVAFVSPQAATHDLAGGLGVAYHQKHARSHSYTSVGSCHTVSSPEASHSDASRASSPSNPDLTAFGFLNPSGTWSCSYPGCTSKAVFTRGCDLRKHHKRHTKSFFCRYQGCSQAVGGGFSSKKDLARHEAKHAPSIVCEWNGCDRIFSRVDNMRDHVKRIHMKAARRASARA